MSGTIKDDVFDYYQELARSAFADMLHDTERNQKYSQGIKKAIQEMKTRGKKANVLDIGTGTGLLSMLAAQHGADTVTTIEAFSPVSAIARKIIESNGFKNKIKIINKHSTEIKVGPSADMEQKANILVAEVLDTELIGEGAIKTYNHAHQNLMEIDCLCIPESASIFVQIVDSPTVVGWNTFKSTDLIKCPENIVNCSSNPAIHDLQLSQFPLNKFTALTPPIKICDFDFSGKSKIPEIESFSKEFKSLADGEANALFFWWSIKMDSSGSILLSCAPHWNHPDTIELAKSEDEVMRRNSIPWRDHWMQGCFYLKPMPVVENGRGFIKATHDEFSWWFEVSQEESLSKVERPICSCMFHIVNSRNRIMQINGINTNLYLKSISTDENSFILFVGDHNLMALEAATTCKVALYQPEVLCYRSIYNFIISNNSIKSLVLINDLSEIEDDNVTHVIGEPHFNTAMLPWDNITAFYKQIKTIRKKHTFFQILPAAAIILAIPVRFLHLHKIRWPLKTTCGGFDHKLFDDVVATASSFADENVEPFSLWEYPCIAMGSARKIFEFNFNDVNIKDTESTLDVEVFSEGCNGVAFWVEWKIDDNSSVNCRPPSTLGELINWKMEERQGVHLIPSAKIEKGRIEGINIKTHFDPEDERLKMDFAYRYQIV